ncbi:hypothetical protein FSP39_022480 [Pinctada imbricata]|uniref:Uncharacterized protein n=1 Tax=Pinctada imbricata TaxID=66713 RepID=A0AA89C1Y7_PINIB|nr:hypothetical protein FSP39_022480 [Pinctada imbricata]
MISISYNAVLTTGSLILTSFSFQPATDIPNPYAKPQRKCILCKYNVPLNYKVNAPVAKSVTAMAAIHDCGFDLIEHLPYSPDLAPSDFHLFPKLKAAGIHFQSNDAFILAVDGFLTSQDKEVFKSGTEALKHQWQKCIDTGGDYVEK